MGIIVANSEPLEVNVNVINFCWSEQPYWLVGDFLCFSTGSSVFQETLQSWAKQDGSLPYWYC